MSGERYGVVPEKTLTEKMAAVALRWVTLATVCKALVLLLVCNTYAVASVSLFLILRNS